MTIRCTSVRLTKLDDSPSPWAVGTTRLTLSSQFEDAVQARKIILSRMTTMGYCDSDVFAVNLALDEALVNAIKHGNRNDPDKQVTVRYRIEENRAWAHVRDQGSGFVPEEVPDPTLVENLSRPSGRGVYLMKSYMDIVHHNRRGNAVFLCKLRTI